MPWKFSEGPSHAGPSTGGRIPRLLAVGRTRVVQPAGRETWAKLHAEDKQRALVLSYKSFFPGLLAQDIPNRQERLANVGHTTRDDEVALAPWNMDILAASHRLELKFFRVLERRHWCQ